MLKSKKILLISIFIFVNIIFGFNFIFNVNSFVIDNINECRTSGISINENNILTKNNDPMVYVDSKKNIYTIEINIDEMSVDFLIGQVFYYNEKSEISEERSIKVFFEVGKNIIYLPKTDNIKNLRIDIGDKENIYIKLVDIQINKNIPIFQHYVLVNIFCIIFSLLFYHKYFNIFLKKNMKYIVFILIIICIFILNINMSSIGIYSILLPNNSSLVDTFRIGNFRGIRGDEFAVMSIRQFMQIYNNFDDISYFFGLEGFNNNLIIESPVFNIISLAKPYTWGFLIFGTKIGFSWYWITQYVVGLYFSYKFFSLFMSKKISTFFSFIVIFSSGLQWWTYTGLIGALFTIIYCSIFILIYDKNDFKKNMSFIFLVVFTLYYIIYLYPPFQVGFGFLTLVIVFSTLCMKKINLFEKIKINKKYFLFYFIFIFLFLIILYLNTTIDLNKISNTVYPGKRISTGGELKIDYFYNYITNIFLPYREPQYLNQSELSSFFIFFPVPFLLYYFKYKELKNDNLIKNMLIYSTILCIYMLIGFPKFISKITLFSYIPDARCFLIFSFSQFLTLLLMVSRINKSYFKEDKINIFMYNICLFLFYYYGYIHLTNIIEYLGKYNYILICIFLFVVSNIIYFGRKKIFVFIMIVLTIFTGLTINPINFGGTEIVTDTPFAKKVRSINQNEPGNWITLNDRLICKYVVAQGVTTLNALNYPPQIEMYQKIDYNKKNTNVYNRYAHPVFELTKGKTEFVLTYKDEFILKLNVSDLKKLDVKYIVTKERIDKYSNDEVIFKEVFYDELDGYIFYKANYTL